MPFTGNEDQSISLVEAAKLTKNYRDSVPANATLSGYFSKQELLKILGQAACLGIRYYYAKSDDGMPKLVLVGVRSDQDDLFNGEIAQHSCCLPAVPPTPAAIIRKIPVIIDRRRVVINRSALGHIFRLILIDRPLRGTDPSLRGAPLRHAAAHIQRGLLGETAFVLPGDGTPAFGAIVGVDQAAAGNFRDDFALDARRGAQIDGCGHIGGFGEGACRRAQQNAET